MITRSLAGLLRCLLWHQDINLSSLCLRIRVISRRLVCTLRGTLQTVMLRLIWRVRKPNYSTKVEWDHHSSFLTTSKKISKHIESNHSFQIDQIRKLISKKLSSSSMSCKVMHRLGRTSPLFIPSKKLMNFRKENWRISFYRIAELATNKLMELWLKWIRPCPVNRWSVEIRPKGSRLSRLN